MDERYAYSLWRNEYSSLKEYYADKYREPYFTLSKDEVNIDPDEKLEEMEQYDFIKQQEEILALKNSPFNNLLITI